MISPDEPLRDRVAAQPPVWADDTIAAWDRNRYERLRPFMTRRYWMESATINVFRVVGTQHPDYAGLTWTELLANGKRMVGNLAQHASNPGYYRSEDRKLPTMYFLSDNGTDWYVGGDGNHRTCIARFDFALSGRSLLHGVSVTDFRFDEGLAATWERLNALVHARGLPATLHPTSTTISRDDAPGWMLEQYQPGIAIEFHHGKRAGQRLVFGRSEAERLADWLERSTWRRWARWWEDPLKSAGQKQ